MFLLIFSFLPVVYAEAGGTNGLSSNPQQSQVLTPEQRGQALLGPVSEFASGSSALAITGEDFRLQAAAQGSTFGTSGQSPELQAASASLVPFRNPTPTFSRNLLITRDFGLIPIQTEPSIAVDPKNPDHLVVAVIDYNSPNIATYVSNDRGSTWDGPYQPRYPEKDIGAAGDPTVVFGSKGRLYASFISIGFAELQIGGIAYQFDTSSVSVAGSADGGVTWGTPYRGTTSTVEVNTTQVLQGIGGHLAIGFLDKPWMSVGPSKSDPSKDSIYLTYTHFVQKYAIVYALQGSLYYFANPVLETTIEMVHSDDGGQTWSQPVPVSPTVSRPFTESGNKRIVQGSQSAVMPDGTVYATWFDSTDDGEFRGLGEIWMARSDDGGQTFQQPVLVDEGGEPAFTSRTADFRSWASVFPQIAAGPKGQVSVAYVFRPPDKPTDDGDIFVSTSTDGGQTWMHTRVNDDGTNAFQFFPSIAYDPGGVIHAMWGDFRDDKTQKSYNIYYARSQDNGKTWSQNTRVTDFPSNPNKAFPRGAFIGDYYSLKATAADVFMVWSDSRLGEFGSFNQKIGFARLTAMKSPSIFVSPPRGTAGRSVEIQGFGFQPQLDYFVSISGNIVTSSRTDRDGRFDLKLFIPIAGQGPQDVTVFDETGNTATASFYIDVGFNTINDQLNKTLQAIGALGQPAVAASSTNKTGSSPTTPAESLSAQLTSVASLMWITTGLSAAAVVIALAAVAIVLKRLPRRQLPQNLPRDTQITKQPPGEG